MQEVHSAPEVRVQSCLHRSVVRQRRARGPDLQAASQENSKQNSKLRRAVARLKAAGPTGAARGEVSYDQRSSWDWQNDGC